MKYSNPLTKRKVFDKLDEIIYNLELTSDELNIFGITGELSQLLYPEGNEPIFEEIPFLYFEIKDLHDDLLDYIVEKKNNEEAPIDYAIEILYDLRDKYE